MDNENEFPEVFGSSDERFRKNYDNTLAKLRAEDTNNKRHHWRMISVIVVVCMIAMTGAAYAASQINLHVLGFVDDVDIGAAWKLVTAPEDYYESEGVALSRGIYRYDLQNEKYLRFDSNTAQALSEILSGNVFTADGNRFDLLVIDPQTGEYYADDRGNTLYDKSGAELAEISYYSIIQSEPLRLETRTIDDVNSQREAELEGQYGIKITFDYTEAAGLLGANFRLPAVYTEYLEPPEYRLQGLPYTADGVEFGPDDRLAVYVTIKGDPGLYFFAEKVQGEGMSPEDWHAPGSIIEECQLADNTVYRITIDGLIRYTWEYDGLVYMIFQDTANPTEFTDEQFQEIILSMIQ